MNTLLAHGGETHDAVAGAMGGHHYEAHEWIELTIVMIGFVLVMAYVIRERISTPKTAAIKTKRPK